MKTAYAIALLSALVLGSNQTAVAATAFLQASSTNEQVASDTKPKAVTMNSTDAAKGMTNENGVVTVGEDGNYFVMAAAQVGGKGKGAVRLWVRINGKDADNSNTEQVISDSSFTAVLVCQGILELKKGDKVEMVYSATTKGLGLIVKKPSGEPVVPSMILSAFKLD